MTDTSRSRPSSSPPSLGPAVRAILLLAGCLVVVASVVALVSNILTPSQAMAVGLVGVSLGAFGVGTGQEFPRYRLAGH